MAWVHAQPPARLEVTLPCIWPKGSSSSAYVVHSYAWLIQPCQYMSWIAWYCAVYARLEPFCAFLRLALCSTCIVYVVVCFTKHRIWCMNAWCVGRSCGSHTTVSIDVWFTRCKLTACSNWILSMCPSYSSQSHMLCLWITAHLLLFFSSTSLFQNSVPHVQCPA